MTPDDIPGGGDRGVREADRTLRIVLIGIAGLAVATLLIGIPFAYGW